MKLGDRIRGAIPGALLTAFLVLGPALVGGCVAQASSASVEEVVAARQNPTVKMVVSSGETGPYGVKKTCDGTTLIYIFEAYNKGGISTIPNSPECGYRMAETEVRYVSRYFEEGEGG